MLLKYAYDHDLCASYIVPSYVVYIYTCAAACA